MSEEQAKAEQDEINTDEPVSTDESGLATPESEQDESQEEQQDVEQGEKSEAESEEIEVVRESQGSQPKKKTKSFTNRINRLNQKTAAEKERADTATSELEAERERNRLLQLALEQSKPANQTPTQPNPDDFEGGAFDPKFVEQQREFNAFQVEQMVNEKINQLKQVSEQQSAKNVTSANLEKKALKHYQRADELKASDFGETEDKAIEVLGGEIVNDIIANFPDSELIVYYLGKNPGEAKEIKRAIEENPVLGVSELGALRKDLKVRPKSKITPDPDEELVGAGVGPPGKRGPKGAKFE